MTRILISHLYKSFTRSSSVGKDTVIQVVLVFIVIVLLGYTLALGFSLEQIITSTFRQPEPVAFINRFLIYFFIGGFMSRYLLQNPPVLVAQPYLHLPIARTRIAHFLIGKSLLHILNISVFLLFAPFAFNTISLKFGEVAAWTWLLSLWLVSIANHFLVVIIKSKGITTSFVLPGLILLTGVMTYLELNGWINVTDISERLFSSTLQGYTSTIILLLAVAFLYFVLHRTFTNELYAESLMTHKTQILIRDINFLHQFGLMGAWISLEVKSIFRNKRSRELFLMHMVFLLLPLGFYSMAKRPDSYGSFLFFGMISSGFFTMNYGQFLFSWQGSHFDFTLSRPVSLRQFVESKYWLLTTTTAIWFLFSIPYLFLGSHFLLINFVASLYNIGINNFVVMNMSMWGAKKINLRHPGSVNMEGMGAAQWVMGLPLLATPYIFYIPFSLMGFPLAGLACIGVVGIIGILLHKVTIQYTTLRLSKKRYMMASNFRKE